MIKDTQLQSLPALTHVQSDRSNIGGVDPLKYGFEAVAGRKKKLILYTSGAKTPGYPAWMWYPSTPRPILPNTGHLSFHMKYAVAGNLGGLNVVETDTILVFGGFKYNASGQWNQASGFQIVDARGDWVDIGFNPGPLTADMKRAIRWEYFFDFTNHTTSMVAVTCDGVRWPVSPSAQKITAQPSNWTTGAYAQIQMGSMPSGTPWSLKVGKMEYIWS